MCIVLNIYFHFNVLRIKIYFLDDKFRNRQHWSNESKLYLCIKISYISGITSACVIRRRKCEDENT